MKESEAEPEKNKEDVGGLVSERTRKAQAALKETKKRQQVVGLKAAEKKQQEEQAAAEQKKYVEQYAHQRQRNKALELSIHEVAVKKAAEDRNQPVWKDEHGDVIPKGRTIVEYGLGFETPFMAHGTQKK